MSLFKRPKLNRDKNLIKGAMPYGSYTDDQGKKKIVSAPNIETVDYATFKSAYNPNYVDAGKIVKIPEDYLYTNTRHHLKDFVIIDGKEDSNGNQVIIGFLGTSQINSKSRGLPEGTRPHDLKGISKIIIDKDKYRRLIRKSRTMSSDKILNELQLNAVKNQSKTTANVNKSKRFRQ